MDRWNSRIRPGWARWRTLLAATCVVLLASGCSVEERPSPTKGQAQVDYALLLDLPAEPIDFHTRVKPILERRCVVCHGCYDAPCQLKLSSPEGLQRGASKDQVYDAARLSPAPPTRLFIDAQTTEEWRAKGFAPVLNEGEASPEANLHDSVLYRMLRLKQRKPLPRVGMLPDSFDLALDREQVCPTLDEFDAFAEEHPLWGMPYAMPNLSDEEYATLVQWLAQGSPTPEPPAPSVEARAQIERWEAFLNDSSKKQQLVSRYLYEHLFHAHIHLEGTHEREFYRLVRSSTGPGEPVREVATLRPNYDAGGPFYYRLLRYHPSVVAKDHVVYRLSDQRLARYRELFLDPDYAVDTLPGYGVGNASNPFIVFAAIPPVSRYKFLLDDARFFIEGFVKGPVCRGQIALSVIEDQFWVVFFDPDRDHTSTDPDFLLRMSEYLQLPADRGSTLNVFAIWTDYWKRQRGYLAAKTEHFKTIHAVDIDDALGHIWDGDGTNPNASLTVFRHFDSGSVRFGFAGDPPSTAWIIDYPLLERIHYLLVADFDVFGNVGHQLNTRLFMEFLRMEGEMYFLAFMPADRRREIRDSWTVGLRENVARSFQEPMEWIDVESVIGFRTDDPQREFYGHLKEHLGAVSEQQTRLARCSEPCGLPPEAEAEARIDQALSRIANTRGPILEVFPDLAFLRVRVGEEGRAVAYALVHNKGYTNLTSMFQDVSNRALDEDTMTVLHGFEGSYPNFFFEVDLENIEDFAGDFASIGGRGDYERFVARYGVRRTSSAYWDSADWFQDEYARAKPTDSGLFDLNRYHNR